MENADCYSRSLCTIMEIIMYSVEASDNCLIGLKACDPIMTWVNIWMA